VATTTQVADFARNVAGDRATVEQVLAPNTDPHEYEVRPRDVKSLRHADLVLSSGGDVDAWLGDALDAAGVAKGRVLEVGAAGGFEGDDPHWWQDPVRVERGVQAIRDALVHADPAGAATYRANAARYVARLKALDDGVRSCMDQVPASQRLLVTSHDALGYYARRYGIRIVGAVIPGLSTEAQPSAGDVAKLVTTIRQTGVRAIFAESSVNPKVEHAIAKQAGARIGPDLWADSLGPKGTPGATYIGSIESNTRALVAGFTGGARRCDLGA
jgi:zinc/manganese transport system substrate-binding protein/manganese/iron transport system substrate-binding protein